MAKTNHFIVVFVPDSMKILDETRCSKWNEAYKAWGLATASIRDNHNLTATWTINHLTYRSAYIKDGKVEEIIFEENSTKKKRATKAIN